jgi:hypothetical protein
MFRHRMRGLKKQSATSPGGASGRHRRRHWVLEGLENRTLLSGSPTIYTVDLTSDTGTGSDNKGDLLYCINQANANTNTAGSEIEFDPAVFQVTTQQSITLSATLDLSETAGPEVVVGPGASDLKITGNDTVEVFSVSSDTTATLSGLTIWGGMTNQSGGGINNQGTLTVTSCSFLSNTSTDDVGGGIANDGTLTITNSTFEDNSAAIGGGIDNEGTLTVTGSTIESNTATDSAGGGIDNEDGGTATITSTTLTSNSAFSVGGGIFYSGTSPMTVTDCTLSSNTARSGGGIYDEGDGHDGHNKLTLANSTLSDNSADGSSSSSGGGGLYARGATVSISGSTFSGNTATRGGGGIFSNAGALTIMDSTLSGNSVTDSFEPGGGLYENGGTLTVTNSTIADNSAGGVGAGIDDNAGTLSSVNCTIADNTEPSGGDGLGGGLNIDQGTATLDNTIIALNTDGTGPDAPPDNFYINGSGTVSTDSANNLIGAGGGNSGLTNGSNGNQVGVADPGLGTLADNGGPTQTIALLAGSPAIDAGKNSLAVDPQGNLLKTDQRGTGFPRVVSGTVDIGAFERPVVTSSPTVYIVDLTSDTGASTSANEGDILYCVTQANANTNLAGSEIEFDPTVFSTATPQTIKLSKALELNPPSGPELIEGPGASIVTVSGNNDGGAVFDVTSSATASLAGLTISGGDDSGINNAGTLTVTNSTIDNNFDSGIDNLGMMTVTNSTIDNNTNNFGGGIYNLGTMTVTDCTLSGNSATAGGGIDSGGPLTITGSTLSDNSAAKSGGGIVNFAQLTVTGSTIEGNTVGRNGSGGGIDNNGTLTVTDSTITNNSAFQPDTTAGNAGGGGLYNSGSATISSSTLSANSGTSGGGIYVSAGKVTVTNSTLSGNSAGDGGGIENQSDGSTTLTNSTLSGNSAGRDGGGIDDEGGFVSTLNATIAGNSVPTGGSGGGVDVSNFGTAILDNTIVATNTAGTGGTTADDIGGTVSSSSASNLIGTGGSGGLTNGSNGNLVGVVDPGLGALASNGGPTQTIALLPGSSAINTGNPTLAVDPQGHDLTTDQRGTGFSREVPDGTVDIGAFELQGAATNPVPVVTGIVPNRIAVGYALPITLQVSGSDFVIGSVVEWNSTALATTDTSGSSLTATIPASDFATQGSFPVTVVNPTPGGGTSSAVMFQVLAAPSVVYVNAAYASDPLGTAVTETGGITAFVGYDAFSTVQAGVTAVAAGGTVDIAAGTYTEQVTITQSLTLDGAGAAVTTIKSPASLAIGSAEIAMAIGTSVAMSGFTVASGSTDADGIMDNDATLSANDIEVVGFAAGVRIGNNGAATVTDSTFVDNLNGFDVGSSTSDTSTLTANNNNLAGNGAGVANIQASGSVDATLNWWGSTSGPTTNANPGGTGANSDGNVDFSPWLGDANLNPYDYLVFSTTAGSNYVVTPNSGNTELEVTTFGGTVVIGGKTITIPPLLLGTIPGGDTLGFAGNGGTITIKGETAPSNDALAVRDTAVEFVNSADHLNLTTINFIGTGMTRDVAAQGSTNTFYIDGAGVSGPSGTLAGDSGTNQFFFVPVSGGAGSKVLGNIQGGGATTLNYSVYPVTDFTDGVDVDLKNGTDGTATGVSGTVSGITAVIGSAFNDNLNAGTVPGVALTGGPGINYLTGTGAGDSVVESIASYYTLIDDDPQVTEAQVDGTNGSFTSPTDYIFTDYLDFIGVANLTGSSSASTFNVSAWIGTGSLTAPPGISTVIASKNANFTLTKSSLQTSDGMSMSLSGINNVNLTGTGHANVFSIINWAGLGSLSATSGVLNVFATDSSITLTDSFVTDDVMYLALSGFTTGSLIEDSDGSPNSGGYTFNVSGWTHQGTLIGNNLASVTASESADITLTNSALTSGTMSMDLEGTPSADLTVTATAGHPSLIIDASTFSGATDLTAAGTVDAILYGGEGNGGALTATGSGNDVLIAGSLFPGLGDAADTTLTDTGTGRNILIGGGIGGDTSVGDGNDILVSGRTEYDSNSTVHQAALEAILAEWASGQSYAHRITRISNGVKPDHRDALNRHTIQTDSNINTLSDRYGLFAQTDSVPTALAHPNFRLPIHPSPIHDLSPIHHPIQGPLVQSYNWFIVSSRDHVTRRSNETKTVI